MSYFICGAVSVSAVQQSLFAGFLSTTTKRLRAVTERKRFALNLLSPKSHFAQCEPMSETKYEPAKTECQPAKTECQPAKTDCQPAGPGCQLANGECRLVAKPLRVTLIEGHGVGPLVCSAARRVLKAAGATIEWDWHTLHTYREPHTGRSIMNPAVLESANSTRLVLRGPESGAQDGSHGSAPLTLHKALGAFVGVRMFSTAGGYEPFGRVRLVNIRENVSGEYSEIEHVVVPGVVQSIKTVTYERSEAVARFTFDYAVSHGHSHVTVLHKANVMRLSDGMFLRACRCVAAEYADRIGFNEEPLDRFCLLVANDPSRYDVLLTPSLYGAFASAVCATLAGGSGMVPTAAYGSDGLAVFSTMDHGADIEYVDDVLPSDRRTMLAANPTGLIRAAAWMLSHVGMVDVARRVDAALVATIEQGVRTRDMGGTASCIQFTDTVVGNLK